MQNSLKIILEKLLRSKITPQDFKQLQSELQETSPVELDEVLKGAWDEITAVESMDAGIKNAIKQSLNQKINGQTKDSRPNKYRWLRIAGMLLLPLVCSAATYLYFTSSYGHKTEKAQEFTIFADRGQKTQVFLPDGTHVWLNSGSKLIYSSDFNIKSRTVSLEGEAFFEVKHDDQLQFSVQTEKLNVMDKGTAFNVCAYPEDSSINVSLLHGSIWLETKEHQSITTMRPNERFDVNKASMKWNLSSCNAETESIWRKNKLIIENAGSAEVFKEMERWYGVTIKMASAGNNNRYNFTVKTESLREMLGLINELTPIKYTINGEEVNIQYQ